NNTHVVTMEFHKTLRARYYSERLFLICIGWSDMPVSIATTGVVALIVLIATILTRDAAIGLNLPLEEKRQEFPTHRHEQLYFIGCRHRTGKRTAAKQATPQR